jgi:DNA-binding CsgD family transcriptional regulator
MIILQKDVSTLLNFADSHSKEIKTICEPLKKCDINYFSYVKIGYDETHYTFFGINNNLEWASHFFTNNGLDNDSYFENMKLTNLSSKIYYCLNPNVPYAKEFGFYNTFNIFYSRKSFIEKYTFANFNRNLDLTSFYINKVNLLHKFITYFKFKTSHFTTDIPNKSAYLTRNLDLNNLQRKDENYEDIFLREIEVKRIQINASNLNLYVTKKELECLHLLVIGKTMKEIANILNISSRTVEDHLNNIKFKTGLTYKSQLVGFFYENFSHLYFFNTCK